MLVIKLSDYLSYFKELNNPSLSDKPTTCSHSFTDSLNDILITFVCRSKGIEPCYRPISQRNVRESVMCQADPLTSNLMEHKNQLDKIKSLLAPVMSRRQKRSTFSLFGGSDDLSELYSALEIDRLNLKAFAENEDVLIKHIKNLEERSDLFIARTEALTGVIDKLTSDRVLHYVNDQSKAHAEARGRYINLLLALQSTGHEYIEMIRKVIKIQADSYQGISSCLISSTAGARCLGGHSSLRLKYIFATEELELEGTFDNIRLSTVERIYCLPKSENRVFKYDGFEILSENSKFLFLSNGVILDRSVQSSYFTNTLQNVVSLDDCFYKYVPALQRNYFLFTCSSDSTTKTSSDNIQTLSKFQVGSLEIQDFPIIVRGKRLELSQLMTSFQENELSYFNLYVGQPSLRVSQSTFLERLDNYHVQSRLNHSLTWNFLELLRDRPSVKYYTIGSSLVILILILSVAGYMLFKLFRKNREAVIRLDSPETADEPSAPLVPASTGPNPVTTLSDEDIQLLPRLLQDYKLRNRRTTPRNVPGTSVERFYGSTVLPMSQT